MITDKLNISLVFCSRQLLLHDDLMRKRRNKIAACILHTLTCYGSEINYEGWIDTPINPCLPDIKGSALIDESLLTRSDMFSLPVKVRM